MSYGVNHYHPCRRRQFKFLFLIKNNFDRAKAPFGLNGENDHSNDRGNNDLK
jgi:hypothetical protein